MGRTTRLALIVVLLFVIGVAVLLDKKEPAANQEPGKELAVNRGAGEEGSRSEAPVTRWDDLPRGDPGTGAGGTAVDLPREAPRIGVAHDHGGERRGGSSAGTQERPAGSGGARTTAAPGTVERREPTPVAANLRAEEPRARAGSVVEGGKVYYIVQKGDKLWDIASRFYGSGTFWRTIAKANPGIDPNRLQVGKRILIGERSKVQRAE